MKSYIKKQVFVGIDNGINGAWGIIDEDGDLVSWSTMPIHKPDGRNEIDVRRLSDELHEALKEYTVVKCLVEKPVGSKSARAGISMAGSFHATIAVLTLAGYNWDRIQARKWQKAMLPQHKGVDTKQSSIELAGKLWPNEPFLRTKRCTTQHDGATDACLIAEYARRNHPSSIITLKIPNTLKQNYEV
jgi:Holliday junction resolvasome RuvABC endonuclease subunit